MSCPARAGRVAVLVLAGALAGPAQALPLDALFVVVAPGWEVVEEPLVVERSPELRQRGLRESVARHYTRARGPVSEVCTIELWRFTGAEQVRAAAASLTLPEWRVHEVGELLVLAHGVRLEREVGSRRGLVEGCADLLERTRARAVERGP